MRSFSQIVFEKGYFINNENMKVECLIRNMDWRNNPKSFEYKIKDADKPVSVTVDSVREFAVLGYSRYVSQEVEIDRSPDYSNDLDALSTIPNPIWHKEKLFLKTIIEGPATLFSYEGNHLTRFFYAMQKGPVEQLIYKPYRIDETNFGYNTTFQTQLKEKLNCGNPNSEKIEYSEKELKKYFSSYSACKGYRVSEQVLKKRRPVVSLKLFSGGSYAGLLTQNEGLGNFGESSFITKFDPKVNIIFGAEFEYFLRFNKNKWSIPFDLYTRSYQASGTDPNGKGQMKYSAVEVASGARYYTYINDRISLFINALLVEDFQTNGNYHWQASSANFYPQNYSVEVRTHTPILAFGAGGSYKKMYAEARYYIPRDIFESNISIGSSFKSFSLLIKYKIF